MSLSRLKRYDEQLFCLPIRWGVTSRTVPVNATRLTVITSLLPHVATRRFHSLGNCFAILSISDNVCCASSPDLSCSRPCQPNRTLLNRTGWREKSAPDVGRRPSWRPVIPGLILGRCTIISVSWSVYRWRNQSLLKKLPISTGL